MARTMGSAAAIATCHGAGPFLAAAFSFAFVNGDESVVSRAGACLVVVPVDFVVDVDLVVVASDFASVGAVTVVESSEEESDVDVEVDDVVDAVSVGAVAPPSVALGTVLVVCCCVVCVLR